MMKSFSWLNPWNSLKKDCEEILELTINSYDERLLKILTYPKNSKEEMLKRIEELKAFGIKAIKLSGPKKIDNLSILGKGCVGLLVITLIDNKEFALKIRRMDASRESLESEWHMQKIANLIGIGPKAYACSKNFLLMELIKGLHFPEWIKSLKGKSKKKALQKVVRKILMDCYKLDEIKLDHGELSRAPKHIIITNENEPIIVDFESSSIHRKPSNLTSICQFLFIGSEVSKSISKILRIDKSALIKALRNYKANRSQESFFKLMNVCNLDF
ncbi:MAG: RIO1 family regulatory kinase/ATPase [Candidatus Bathyarchaeia archaeon]